MQPNKQLNRLFAALGREGLEVSREDRVYRVRRKQEGGPPAEDCITLREERRVEEAPAAYKPIEPVIACQVEAGTIDVVARLRPLMTFKA